MYSSTSCLSLHCNSCGHSEEFYTAKKVGHCFEVNRRMIYGMRSIGCGLSGMKKLCSTMDMPHTTQKPSCVLPRT